MLVVVFYPLGDVHNISELFPLTSKSGPREERSNASAKALAMSLKYSFVTPLTSMVVTQPETPDGPSEPLIADKLTEGRRHREAWKRNTNILTLCFIEVLTALFFYRTLSHCNLVKEFPPGLIKFYPILSYLCSRIPAYFHRTTAAG